MMNWSGGMGGAGWVLMSVFWVVAIVAIVWAVMALLGRHEIDRPEQGSLVGEPARELSGQPEIDELNLAG